MFVTAILMLLLLASWAVAEKKDFKGLTSFDPATILPLRGLLALLIVSHHLGQKTDIFPLSNITAGIGQSIVAIFFFISGYGLCVSYMAKGEIYLDGFLKKRMGKLLPKFLFLTVGIMVAYHSLGLYSLETQISKFLFKGEPPLPNSWFIYAIICVYSSFYLCALLVKNHKHLGLLFTFVNVLYVLVTAKIFHFPSHWYLTIILTSFGYFVALYEKRISAVLTDHKFLCYSSLVALLLILRATVKIGFLQSTFLWLEVWFLAEAFSVYVIIRTLGFFRWKWLCRVGVYSLEIYLIHGIPMLIGQHIGLESWSLWFFTYALSLPLAILLNRGYDLICHTKVFSRC